MARQSRIVALSALTLATISGQDAGIDAPFHARQMKFGAPIMTSELSGSLGGITASSSRGGVGYFRVRARPGNPRTTFQSVVRQIMASIAGAWRSTLTGVQRAAWQSLSPSSSSGIDSYIKGNSQRELAGVAREDDAPDALAFPNVPLVDDPVVDASAHTITFGVPTAETIPEVNYNVFISAQQSPSRLSRQFGFTYAGSGVALGAGDTSTITLPTTHPSYNLVAGQVVYVRIVSFGSSGGTPNYGGSVGTPQEFRLVVVA